MVIFVRRNTLRYSIAPLLTAINARGRWFCLRLSGKSVKTFPGLTGGNIGPSVQIRRKAKHEFPGKWLFLFMPKLLAEGKIVFPRIMKRLSDFVNGCPLKGDDISNLFLYKILQLC